MQFFCRLNGELKWNSWVNTVGHMTLSKKFKYWLAALLSDSLSVEWWQNIFYLLISLKTCDCIQRWEQRPGSETERTTTPPMHQRDRDMRRTQTMITALQHRPLKFMLASKKRKSDPVLSTGISQHPSHHSRAHNVLEDITE